MNPDIIAQYRRSTGNTVGSDYSQTPSYAPAVPVRIQPQALKGTALRHAEALNLQGVLRTVYMYGNTQAVFRPLQTGADLLQFPLVPNGPALNWLVVDVVETWDSWCNVTVCLQA